MLGSQLTHGVTNRPPTRELRNICSSAILNFHPKYSLMKIVNG
ncbi:hypothetical protein MGWOODY_XGa1215 [hydrothermal vent metagenome]|uniref:Uncharacterized protein n=1 Tax=hydrothermal vent metagenome TaxID=652676 RepID=A0A160TV47_9ZZZZ